jgi:gentisate 1,2-dioxygenase
MAGKGTAVIDFGATPVAEKQFTITDAAISSTSIVEAFVQVLLTGDNNAESHRHAAASWKLVTEAGTGSFLLDVTCLIDMCHGTFNIQYAYA